MSLLNPSYLQPHGGTMTNSTTAQGQQGNQMMHSQDQMAMYPGYDPSMYFDPTTMQTMAQSGMFNMGAMMVPGNVMYSQPYVNAPTSQIAGRTIDFSEDVNFGEGNAKAFKKRSRTERDRPAKRAKPEDRVTIFVGSLHPDADEDAVWEFFEEKEVGVAAARKKIGKMFAHIDLIDPNDLHKALALNGQFFMGLAIRLEKSSGTVAGVTTEGKDTKTLFVANLSDRVTEKALREFFPESLEVRYPVNKRGNHVGYAFLRYDDEEKVKSLIDKFQGENLEGNTMILDYAAGKTNTKTVNPCDKDDKSLFVGNLPTNVTEEDIAQIFPDACEIRFPNDGRTSYCFVKFNSDEEATLAMKKKGTPLHGHDIIIDYAVKTKSKKKEERPVSGNTHTLVVKNLSFKTTEERLRQEFPEVTTIRMVYFPGTQRPKGYAFLEFKTVDDADDVFYEINDVGRTIYGRVAVAEYALEKGSQAFKDRGKQMEEEKINECKRKSLWGPHGMAYEGVEIPSNFAYGGLNSTNSKVDNSVGWRGYGSEEPYDSRAGYNSQGGDDYWYDYHGQGGNEYEYQGGGERGRGGYGNRDGYSGGHYGRGGYSGGHYGEGGSSRGHYGVEGYSEGQYGRGGNSGGHYGGGGSSRGHYGGHGEEGYSGEHYSGGSNKNGRGGRKPGGKAKWTSANDQEEEEEEEEENQLPFSFTGRSGRKN